MLDILIVMNNYFHDVATAVLLSAAVIMWALYRQARRGGPAEVAQLARAYPLLTRFALIALAWVVLGGIPRVVFFATHDLGAVRDDLALPIAVKHVVEVAAVLAGVVLWRRVNG
ncbi:MAG: hypothetical protein Q8K89_12855, partial [Actinomycetota bacterium]|nr:hypothetical protein [Actinomycetota bacterium]